MEMSYISKNDTICMLRSEISFVCVYYWTVLALTIFVVYVIFLFSVSETLVTTELLCLMVLRRVESEHHLFTPQLLPMKLMNMIMNKQ